MKLLLSTFVGLWAALLLLCSSTHAFSSTFGVTTARQSSTSKIMMSDGATADSSPALTGTVKWFNTMKGFGFIVPDDESGDIFVHQTAIKADGFRSLADGERVEYRTEVDDTGRKRAVSVTGPNGADVQGAPFRPQDDYGGY